MIANNIIGILTSTLHEALIHPWVLDLLSVQQHRLAIFRCHNEMTRGELALRIRKEFRLARCGVFDVDFTGSGLEVRHYGRGAQTIWNTPPAGLFNEIKGKEPDAILFDDVGNGPGGMKPWEFWRDFIRDLRAASEASGSNVILLQVKDRYKSINFVADYIAECNLTVDGFDVEVIKDRIGHDFRKMRQPR